MNPKVTFKRRDFMKTALGAGFVGTLSACSRGGA